MTLTLGLTLVASLGLSAGTQSLADVARKTQEDRDKSKAPAAKVITNDDLKPGRQPADAPVADPKASAEALKKQEPAADPKAAATAPVDTKGEAYWHGRWTVLDAKLTDDLQKESVVSAQLKALMVQIASTPADDARYADLINARTSVAADVKAIQEVVSADRNAIVALQEEGRKAGAKREWFR